MVSGCQKASPLRSEVIEHWGSASKPSDLVSPFPELSGTGHFVDKEMANCSFSEKPGEGRHTYYACWRFPTVTTATFKYRAFSYKKVISGDSSCFEWQGPGIKGTCPHTLQTCRSPLTESVVLSDDRMGRSSTRWVENNLPGLRAAPSTTAEPAAKTWKTQSVEGRCCTLFWWYCFNNKLSFIKSLQRRHFACIDSLNTSNYTRR